MTSAEVKAELPNVKIRVDGKNYIGLVRGRKMPFATVHIQYRPSLSFEFAWTTIARALTRNTALIA